ncbi:MAG: nitrile hydratase accessory protein [Gammaproteobacteria bacterium]
MAIPDIASLPGLPLDDDGPVFKAPWQAQAFALVVRLHEQGTFTWQEWTEQLGKTIAKAHAEGDPDLGDTYYHHWLAALESITTDKGLVTPKSLSGRKHIIHQEHQRLHNPDN